METHSGVPVAALLTVVGVIICISVVVAVVICFLISDALKRLPASFRKMDPAMVWLLLIPCFNIIWNFVVFPKVSDSYSAYFASQGRTDVGDAARGLGIAYAICAVCSLIPRVGALAGLASLVLLIIYLVKITGWKNQVQQTPQA